MEKQLRFFTSTDVGRVKTIKSKFNWNYINNKIAHGLAENLDF